MHTDELVIKLCLEILLQFTHEEGKKNYMSNRTI